MDRRSIRILYTLFLTACSLLILNPYQYGVHDHWYMIPWIRNLINPDLFPVDPIIVQRQYHYSILYHFVAWSPFSIELSFFILYMLSIAVLIYMSMAIHRLFSKSYVGLTPLFLLIPWFTPGGTWTVASHLLMRTMGLPFLLLTVYLWLKNKSLLAWLVLGISFLFHPTTALYMATFMGIDLLLDSVKRREVKEWFSILIFIVFIIPSFAEKFGVNHTGFNGFLADPYWLDSIRIRSSHHAFPDTWLFSHILSGLLLFGVLFFLAVSTKIKRLRNFLIGILLGVVIIYAGGLLFTYVWPAYLGIQIQPFRISRIMMILALLFTSVLLSNMKELRWGPVIFSLVTFSLLYGAYNQTRFHLFVYTGMLLPLLSYWLFPKIKVIPAVILASAVCIILMNKPLTALQPGSQPEQENKNLYNWVLANTSPKSLWIIPSDMMCFREFADRSALVAWCDGTFGYFDHNYNREWRTRYEKVFGAFDEAKTEPQINNLSQLKSLTDSVSEGKVFMVKREALSSDDFKEVWSDSHFHVYTPRH